MIALRLKRFAARLKNREFGYIAKRLSTFVFPQFYGSSFYTLRWGYNFCVFSHWTRFLRLPQDYSYLIAGSHAVGYAAFVRFLEIIGANPQRLDGLFASSDWVLFARKHAKKYDGQVYGFSLDKAYRDPVRRGILARLKKKVPVFVLVRDPISIIKSQTHGALLPLLIRVLKNGEIRLLGGGSMNFANLAANHFGKTVNLAPNPAANPASKTPQN